MAEDPLAEARRALDRGEYGQVLRLLDPLAADRSPASVEGAELRLLMATALMGQGHTDRAAACCRSLRSCRDPVLRSQARALLAVLEAPELRRPRDWSLTLPDLSGSAPIEGLGRATARRQRKAPESPPPPPVGPTRAPIGFALVVVLVLLLLTGLLAGCMEFRTDLRFDGPGRLQLSHQLRSPNGSLTPWQRRFAAALTARSRDGATPGPFRLRQQGNDQILSTPVMPASEALNALAQSVVLAGELSGAALPSPMVLWQERNWLVGVHQHLQLELDLRATEPLAGLDLAMGLEPLRPQAVVGASPLPIRSVAPGEDGAGKGHRLLWPLQPGTTNRLELRCWRWSSVGLGGVVIALALLVVLGLQGIRRRLGFGLPELPA